jgi:hypothetical protein
LRLTLFRARGRPLISPSVLIRTWRWLPTSARCVARALRLATRGLFFIAPGAARRVSLSLLGAIALLFLLMGLVAARRSALWLLLSSLLWLPRLLLLRLRSWSLRLLSLSRLLIGCRLVPFRLLRLSGLGVGLRPFLAAPAAEEALWRTALLSG